MASTIRRVLDRLRTVAPTADESQFLLGVLAGMSPTKMDQALDYLDQRRASEARQRTEAEGPCACDHHGDHAGCDADCGCAR